MRTLLIPLPIVVAFIVFFAAPSVMFAAPVIRSGETISVSEAQAVGGDFYAGAGAVTISGSIAGDVYTAGGTVTVNGDTESDVVAIGGTVQIHGPVGDDVRIAGGDVVIAGDVAGDVVVLAGTVRILSTAHIAGDLLFMGGEIDMDGEVEGAMSGRARTVKVNGAIGGDMSVRTSRTFELGDQSVVEGNVIYVSAQDIVRAPGSVVEGDVTKGSNTITTQAASISAFPLLLFLFTALVYLTLFKKQLGSVAAHMQHSVGLFLVVGFGTSVAIPLVSILLMVTVIGLPVGAALLLFFLLMALVSWSLSGITVGIFLSQYFDDAPRVTLKWALIGTVALGVVSYVPYLGTLFVGLAVLVTFGVLAMRIYPLLRRRA